MTLTFTGKTREIYLYPALKKRFAGVAGTSQLGHSFDDQHREYAGRYISGQMNLYSNISTSREHSLVSTITTSITSSATLAYASI
jgi:hypothetical protein